MYPSMYIHPLHSKHFNPQNQHSIRIPKILPTPPITSPIRSSPGFLTWVNCTNVKWATKVQDVFTGAKLLALVIIVGAGVYHLAAGNLDNYQKPFEGTNWEPAAFATAFYQGLFSFAGW